MSVYEDLREQIAESFSRDAIERILSDTLNIDFSDLPGGGDYVQLLFELQRKGLQEGWYEDFLKELAKRRPSKAPFQAAIKAVLDDMHKENVEPPAPVRKPQPLLDDPRQPAPAPNTAAALRTLAGNLANLRTARQVALGVLVVGAAIWAIFGWVPVRTLVSTYEPGAGGSQRNTAPVPYGYSVTYRGLIYGTNGKGEAHIIVSPLRFANNWLTDSALSVEVAYGNAVSKNRSLSLRDPAIQIESSFGAAGPANPGAGPGPGANADPQTTVETRFALADVWSLVGTSHATPATGARLYVQSITGPPGITPATVTGVLSTDARSIPLLELGANPNAQSDAQIPLRPNTTITQSYQLFFDLPQAKVPPKSVVRLQAQAWFGGYVDSFTLPDKLAFGEQVSLKSDRNSGASLVVQLTYPVDVVFFERAKTPPVTKRLQPMVAAAGFATRMNTRGSQSGGFYNVVYAGEDVPPEALQHLLKAVVDGGVKLKYVQAGIKLSSGIQNQIQIGSNDAVACLDDLNPAQIKQLLGPPAELLGFIGKLPKPKPGDDCVKDD